MSECRPRPRRTAATWLTRKRQHLTASLEAAQDRLYQFEYRNHVPPDARGDIINLVKIMTGVADTLRTPHDIEWHPARIRLLNRYVLHLFNACIDALAELQPPEQTGTPD